jgi:hypothetical protein
MRLYHFSPIQNQDQLIEAITHIHIGCFKLCHQALGKYLPIAGNVAIFCHYEGEYVFLTKLREELTESSDNPNQKYYRLLKPIVIPKQGDIPETTYTHLYIRKPDPYRFHVGDIDFILDEEKYLVLKQSLLNGKQIAGARIFPRTDLDMIELYNPDSDVLGYVSPEEMTYKARVKIT